MKVTVGGMEVDFHGMFKFEDGVYGGVDGVLCCVEFVNDGLEGGDGGCWVFCGWDGCRDLMKAGCVSGEERMECGDMLSSLCKVAIG